MARSLSSSPAARSRPRVERFCPHHHRTGPLLDRPAAVTQGLQLASGVVFICMLFAGSAAVGAIALMLHFASVPALPVSVDRVLTSMGYGLVFVYGSRVAGMFTITTTTASIAAAF